MKICRACGQSILTPNWQCSACGKQTERRDGVWLFAPEIVEDNDMYASTWHDKLFHAEASHFWFLSRNRLLIWAFGKYFPNASSFLELGCGTGFVAAGITQAYSRLRMSLGDMFLGGLQYAASRVPEAALYQLDVRQLPFDQEFDTIGLFDVLEHIDDDARVLKEAYRAVKPGGGILLTVPQHPSLWSAIDDASGHKRRYTHQELTEKVRQAGFEVSFATSFISLLLPIMMLSRRRKRRAQEKYDIMAEFKLPHIINRFLEQVLRIEYQLIRLGCRFSVGGSLLMVAERRPTDIKNV